MNFSSLSRPSPAMVVACVALSFALAGSAVAGTDALNKRINKFQVKKIAKQQAKKQIKKQAPKLSVDRVDGYHANSLVRSAFSQIAANALVGPSVPAVVRTATIEAPGTGYLLVNAGSDVSGSVAFTGLCSIRVDGVVIPSSDRTWHVSPTSNTQEDCTTETTVQVAAGPHTVDLYAANTLPANVRYSAAELQILYVPFGATGAQPASAARSSSGGGDSDGN